MKLATSIGLAAVLAATPAAANVGCLKPDTRSILRSVQSKFKGVKVISTCRKGATIAGTKRPSYHRWGMAVDISVPRGQKQAVVNYLKTQPVLVMTYHNMGHIHFNTGQKGVITGANAYGGKRKRK